MTYIGIDLGTSAVKVVLMSDDGSILASAASALSVSHPKLLWHEQQPEAWWDAVQHAMADLQASHATALAAARAIGLSGQMHGLTLLGKKNEVLRPCILWCDGRSQAQCEQLERAVAMSGSITGNIMMPGFTAGKALWVKQNEPEIFKKIHKVLLPKDYLRFRMTGQFATDLSDASGTMWLDVGRRDWCDRLLAACGLDRSHMPQLHEGNAVTGTLTAPVAAAWGVPQIPVIAGGGDNAAGALGVGLRIPGQAMLSLGTSGVYFVVTEGFHTNTEKAVHTFCHALPDTWHMMSVMLSCTSCLDWGARLTRGASTAAFAQEAEHADVKGTSPLWFLPYLAGERTPHSNPYAKGVLFGLTSAHTRADVARAILEGVTFALADGVQAVHRSGLAPKSITILGGGSQNPFWRQMVADVTGFTITYSEANAVGPARGAALLARAAMEPTAPLEALFPASQPAHRHEPHPESHTRYTAKRVVFRHLYRQLLPFMSAKY